MDELAEKPWQKPGADITDYFNYNFTESTWRAYCIKQLQMQMKNSMQQNIQVYEGGGANDNNFNDDGGESSTNKRYKRG